MSVSFNFVCCIQVYMLSVYKYNSIFVLTRLESEYCARKRNSVYTRSSSVYTQLFVERREAKAQMKKREKIIKVSIIQTLP